MKYLIKRIVFLYFFLNSFAIFSQENSNYIETSMDEIIQYAIRVSTEHFTEEELNIPRIFSTYFSNALYTNFHKWTENDLINISNSEQFDLIKNSLLMIGRPKNYLEHYQYYAAFHLNDVVIIFIFSDILKEDFETWVKPGSVVKFYLQLASYELSSKVIMFVVNKYEV
jgi:hypothetical protein